MSGPRLDQKLLQKIADKLGRKKRNINVLVSQRANKLGISSEAALAIVAKEAGIGVAVYQRRLSSDHQAEIRSSLPSLVAESRAPVKGHHNKTASNIIRRPSQRDVLKAAIEFVIQDDELRSRCTDLLLARSHFDRAVNQATLILEDRLRAKSMPPKKLVGENLAGYSLNGDLSRTVLKISDNRDEQRGFCDIVRGMVPAFRNTTHHHVVDTITREDALRVCGFVDVLLRLIDNSTKLR